MKIRNKIFQALSLFSLGAFCCYSFSFAQVSPAQNQINNTGIVEDQYGQVYISTGPDVEYHSVQISKSEHKLFCNSNTFEVKIERRVEDSDEKTVLIQSVLAELNGQKVDFFNGSGVPSNINEFRVVDADMSCVENDWVIYLTGYSDSVTKNGATLASLKINTLTGKLVY